LFFSKLRSSVIGSGAPIIIPTPDTQTDWEAELAFVIGRTARHVKPERASDYIFGYTLVNDVSARDVMVRDRMQITLSKSPDTFGPLGPHVVTADAVPDVNTTQLELTTRVNGVLKQRAMTTDMVFAIPELLEFLTRTMTLQPGDIVSTGTPGGTGMGRDPQEFMQPGDEVTVALTGVGELINPVLAGWTDTANPSDRTDR
jgi:2-keto-4-pentenoate hydratase/2-oxohepta-3-ene-1,7-dioic acid hydratase in catechol pathway